MRRGGVSARPTCRCHVACQVTLDGTDVVDQTSGQRVKRENEGTGGGETVMIQSRSRERPGDMIEV